MHVDKKKYVTMYIYANAASTKKSFPSILTMRWYINFHS